MKNREVEVWIHPNDLKKLEDGFHYRETIVANREIVNCFKAKLIIEVPEKRVEISESDLDYILRYCGCKTDGNIKSHLTQKLFGA